MPEQVAAVDGARGTGRSRFIELTETVTIRGLTWSETTAAGGPSRDAIASPVAAAVAAGGCFEATIKYGNTGMWGYMKQTWCNNGATVTYFPDSICWGSSSWPTYNYMGCSRSNTFGAGWTFGRSTVSWHMCISYVPIWGACAWSIARTETWQVNQSNSLMSRISVSGP